MSFEVDIRADVKEVTRYLSRVQRKQLPFATALALTRTAQDAQKATKAQLPKKLDRPRAFTVNSVAIKGAKKNNLISTVYFKDIAAKYLYRVLSGGVKRGTQPGIIVPYRHSLDKYGGIKGKRRKAPEWRQGKGTTKKQFVATIKGIHGVWERTGGKKNPGVKLLAVFEKQVTYEHNKFPFHRIAEGVARSKFRKNFEDAIRTALATAR